MKNFIKNFIKNFKFNKLLLSIFLFIPFFYLTKRGMRVDNDSWFLLNYGHYVLENGFTHIEPFTMHQNFNFTMQQWLFSVIFYIMYEKCTFWGIIIFTFLLYLLIYFVFYKLCLFVSKNNRIIATVFSIIFSTLFISNNAFFASRPQMVSYLIIILWIYICEKYYVEKKLKYLLFLPLLSILEINFHASCWFFLFIFSIPFCIDYAFDSFKNRKISEEFKLFVIASSVAFAVGLINPYGTTNMIYISYAFHGNTDFILEMTRPELLSDFTKILFSLLLVYILVLNRNKNKNKNIRHIFFIVGTLAFSLSTIKSVIYFVIISLYCISSLLPDFLKNRVSNKKPSKKQLAIYTIICLISICTISFYSIKNTNKNITNFEKEYKEIKKDLAQNIPLKNSKVYTGYNSGALLEYIGYKCFIDARAEVFYKEMNKKDNIFDEYDEIQRKSGKLEREKFLKKYKFTHLFIQQNDVFYSTKKIKGYTLVKNDKRYRIYTRNDLLKGQKK